MLAKAGFVGGTMHGWTGYRTSKFTQGALITAQQPACEQPQPTHRR